MVPGSTGNINPAYFLYQWVFDVKREV